MAAALLLLLLTLLWLLLLLLPVLAPLLFRTPVSPAAATAEDAGEAEVVGGRRSPFFRADGFSDPSPRPFAG
jgi:hypothetical protein